MALATSALAGAVLWSLPILAAGLVALLRYSFGSLFVVGESLAASLLGSTGLGSTGLRSTGADIAGTLQRLQDNPLAGIATAAPGLLLALAAASLAWRHAAAATLCAAASAGWAWHCGMPVTALALLPGCLAGAARWIAPRP